MFRLGLILLILGMACTGGCSIWMGWWYPSTYEYALKLADDASLPQAKADYLQEYLDQIDSISGPPRYIFKRPDLDLAKQKIILSGLITRFRDIAKLNPSEMAYQQGMFQLTGQEVDHQLSRISGIFKDAKLRENPFFYFSFWVISWVLWIVGSIMLIPWD